MYDSDRELIHILGNVETVLFQSNESGFCVCDVASDDGDLFTATGDMPYASVGERVDLYGYWTLHRVYGRQFVVERFEKILPTEKNDILRYLSSGAVKGIGPKLAQKIVEKYGEDTFEVISKHPEWLAEIKGISLTKAREMSHDFNEKSGVRDILMLCKDRFSPAVALKIYQAWGAEGVGIIRQNPYVLCDRIHGIGFKMADEMAMEHGIDKESPNRIKSAIIYVLRIFASRDGHTYALRDKVVEASSKLIEVSIDMVAPLIEDLAIEDKIKIVSFHDEMHIYLKENYEDEEYIAKKLLLLKRSVLSVDYSNASTFIEQIERQNGIQYAKMQKRAIEEALMSGVTIITGGPGTGKTTIVKALIQIFAQMGLRCGLCAPTGRASQRMSEATSHEATTVHKLLEAGPGNELESGTVFEKNEKNLLDKDVIIVDESSMLDVHLTCALLKAIKPGARLVLIGDVNQLPSVGEGEVLNDIIHSDCFSVVELNEIFRQAEESGIVMNAYEINNGKIPDLTRKYNDFFFISIDREEKIPSYIAELCSKRLPSRYGVNPFLDIQVITPTKKGPNGTQNLNVVLQQTLNAPSRAKGEKKVSFLRTFRDGDKVMQTKNDYSHEWKRGSVEGTGVFNGDVGIIKEIKHEEGTMTIDFDGKLVTYDTTSFDEIEHAYAITVHKSQGSEYPIVIIPMTKSAPMLLTRNLIYTAITRAEKMVILLGDKEIFYQMIENDRHIERNTGLCHFLRTMSYEG